MRRILSRFKNWINCLWQKLKHSKFFLAMVMLIIGIVYTNCYLTIKYEYQDFFNSRVVIFNNISAKVVSVKTGTNPEVEKMTSLEARGEEQSSPTVRLIEKTFPECPDTMIAIARAESHFRTDAENINSNGTKDCGIFQINTVHGYDCEWLKNPENNIKVAREVYEKQGLTAWTVYNNSVANNQSM